MSVRRCAGCGREIKGVSLTALGSVWHLEHFVCAACGRPIGRDRFYKNHDAPYHDECYRHHVAPRCTYCGQPLMGQYLVDHWGAKFCPRHQSDYTYCRFCGRLVPPHSKEWAAHKDDGIRCPACRASAIDTISQARPLFARLVRWVNGQGLLYNNLDLHIKLCSQSRLTRLLHKSTDPHTLGATMHTTHTRNGQVVRTEVNGVAILRGLPSTLFQGVTVHELGHAWLAVHRVTGLPSWAEEGFCELLAHQFYAQMDTAESRYHATCIEENTDPIYGDGFRRIHALTRSSGFRQLIKTLYTTKQLP